MRIRHGTLLICRDRGRHGADAGALCLSSSGAYVERLERAADPKLEGRRICIEVLRALAEIPGVAGAHVMAPMNFAEIPAVISESGVAGRHLAHAVH